MTQQSSSIRHIIFDLGGVLFDIDYQRPVTAFARLGYGGFEQLYSQAGAHPLFEQLETGHVSPAGFVEQMIALATKSVTGADILSAWNSILLQFRQASMQYLRQLQPHYQLYLLSNTNAIHLVQIQSLCRQQTGQMSLNDFFTKAWYSHEVGMRKPNADIYQFVLQDGGLPPQETLFIDDSVQNIEAAQRLGIQTHWLQPGQQIERLGLLPKR
jgi:glucose-1-phosphatase